MRTIRETYRRIDAIDREALPYAPSEKLARMEAENASNTLGRECQAMFFRFAKRHRITANEARILLQDTGTRI